MNKDDIRKEYLELRREIIDRDLKSRVIINKIINNDFYIKADVIAIYCSLFYEVSTDLLIEECLTAQKVVAVPRVIDKDKMEFYRVFSLSELDGTSSFGVREPSRNIDRLIEKNDIDVMIIPGVCFDLLKNRIGYGKGYYDRYLDYNNGVYKMGICFDEQVLDFDIPIYDSDIKMDEIITDKRMIK